jgi:hypothetical protein
MRFAKAQEKKMGRPEAPVKKREPQKSPISKIWISTFSFPGGMFGGGIGFREKRDEEDEEHLAIVEDTAL